MSFYRNEIPEDGHYRAPTRVHYPWDQLEEYQDDGGMWKIPAAGERGRFADAAEQLMANPDSFRDAMRRALDEWPRSVAVALTNPSLNHRAWIGHAGCYLATGSPEEATRIGWHQLDEGEQAAANAAADEAIEEWHARNGVGHQPTLWDMIPSLRTFGVDDA